MGALVIGDPVMIRLYLNAEATLDQCLGPFGLVVFDRGAFVNSDQAPWSEVLGHPFAGGLAFDGGECFDVHDKDGQAIECFVDGTQLGLLAFVWRGDPTDDSVWHIFGEVVWDLLVRPVSVHTFWRDDQGEVDFVPEIQVADRVDKHFGFGSHLMGVRFGFEFVVDSHLFLLYGHNLRTTTMFVNPET
jgi:hypothetical protein